MTRTYTLDTIDEIVDLIIAKMDHTAIFTFSGPLGAGKTTLIKKILEKKGVFDLVVSPTFTTVMEYTNSAGQTFCHFDLYRMNSLDDFVSGGFQEYLHQPDSWAFVEWPEVIAPLLKKGVCHFTIDYLPDYSRKITFKQI